MRVVMVRLAELEPRQVVDVPFPVVWEEELGAEERTQFERVLFPVPCRRIVRVDEEQAAPGLKPRLECVDHAGNAEVPEVVVALRIRHPTEVPKTAQLAGNRVVREERNAVLVRHVRCIASSLRPYRRRCGDETKKEPDGTAVHLSSAA